MIELLLISLITAFAILGYHKASQPDYILGDFHSAIISIAGSDKYTNWILTPIFLCPYCMSSFWTILAHFYFAQTFDITNVLIGIFATCGIVTLKPE